MEAVTLPDNLPSVATARLPATYEQARLALVSCECVDECLEWANKAEALASYAKMADDSTLRQLADRIQARAVRRMGELLKEFEPAGGARLDLAPRVVGQPRSRTEFVMDAKLSQHQAKQAMRVANVPEDEFERAVESDNPPTVTALAEHGKNKKPINLGDRSPEEFAAATSLIGLVAHIKRIGDGIDLDVAARGLAKDDKLELLTAIIVADDFLKRATTAVRKALA